MASNITTLSFIGFINLFMIPFIGLKTYCKRHSVEWTFGPNVVYFYVLITTWNILLTRIFVNIIERFADTIIYVETTKYMLISLISSIILPYIMEVFENFIQIRTEISLYRKKHATDDRAPEGSDEKE